MYIKSTENMREKDSCKIQRNLCAINLRLIRINTQLDCEENIMYIIQKPVEFAKTNQQMDLENSKSFGEVPRVKNNALRKGTEKNNVLRNNIRIKSEIGTTTNSPISCLNRDDFDSYSITCLII